jgi:hypothetical protein
MFEILLWLAALLDLLPSEKDLQVLLVYCCMLLYDADSISIDLLCQPSFTSRLEQSTGCFFAFSSSSSSSSSSFLHSLHVARLG